MVARIIFLRGMEISLTNLYILYRLEKQKRNETSLNRLRFIKTLVDRLRGDFRQPRDRASTSTANFDKIRLNGKFHEI